MIEGELRTQTAPEDCYVPVTDSAWRLALADTTGDGRNDLIYGAWDGAVRCQDLDGGALLWEAHTYSFPFDVTAADVDGDGRAETFAAAANGGLYAFGPDGAELWSFRSKLPLYNVAVGRLCEDRGACIVCGGIDRRVYVFDPAGQLLASHQVEWLVHRLATGDLDGDGHDEIFVVDGREYAEALKLEGGELRRMWRRAMEVPEEMRNWENPRGHFFAFSVDLADLDGDGRDEIVMGDTYFNKQAVAALSPDGDPLWIAPGEAWRFEDDTYTEFYSTAFVEAADVLPDRPGPEVVAVSGGVVRLLGSDGELLERASARVGFTDLAIDGRTAYLGSSPNGDDTVYRAELTEGWRRVVEGLRRRGRADEVGRNLARLRTQVLNREPTEECRSGPHWVRQFRMRAGKDARERYLRRLAWFRDQLPYENLRYLAGMKVIEPEPPTDENGRPWSESRWRTDSINGTMTVGEIVESARWVEQHEVPTVFNIGHSCMPFVTLETAEKMLREAPNYLVGFISSEDEQLERVGRYLQDYFGPLADLCARHGGKQAMTKNKNVWWMSVPAIPECYRELFGGKRPSVLVAVTEDSNSRTPEINLLARLGLRQAGLIDRNRVTVNSDLFSFCRFHQWEYPKSGHPFLRLMVAHTLLGGADYELRTMHVRPKGDSFTFTDIGRESTEIFLHMLGKGLVFTPEPQQIVISPLGIAVHAPPEKWLRDGHNGHRPWIWEDDPELHEAVIPHNGCEWGNTPTPPHALQAVLLNKRRQSGLNVPPTPYGAFAIVPAQADLDRVVGVEEWWHTDCISIWREGSEKLTGAEAADALAESFERAARRLPFRAAGSVFFQPIRLGAGRYRLYAIDPGWVDPAPHEVEVRVQPEGQWQVEDLLTGEGLPVEDGSVRFTVPAGSMRILEATSV